MYTWGIQCLVTVDCWVLRECTKSMTTTNIRVQTRYGTVAAGILEAARKFSGSPGV